MHSIVNVLTAVLLFASFASQAHAQFGDLPSFNPFDNPTVRQFGKDISSSLEKLAPKHRQSTSGLSVMSYKVDEDGNVYSSGRSDQPFHRNGERAELRHYPNGQAYWFFQGESYRANPKYNRNPNNSQQTNQLRERFAGTNVVIHNTTPDEFLVTLHFETPGGQVRAFNRREILRPNEKGAWTVPPQEVVAFVDLPQGRFYRLLVEAIHPVTGQKFFWGPTQVLPGLMPSSTTQYSHRNGDFIEQYMNLHIDMR